MLGRILALWVVVLALGASYLNAADFNLQQSGSHELSQYIEYWSDTSSTSSLPSSTSLPSRISLIDVSRAKDWLMSNSDNINLGFSSTPYWFKATINQQHTDLDWYIRIAYPPLDIIELYICDKEIVKSVDTDCVLNRTGDHIPFQQRERFNPNYIIPIELKTGNNYLYIKVVTEGSYQLPISLLDTQSLNDYLAINDFFRGGYLSLMVVMMLYNLFIFFMIRSPTYLLYSGFVFTFTLFHMAYEGSGFQFLWPQWPAFNQFAMPITFALNQIFTVLFIVKFLNIKKTSRNIYYYFNLLLALAITTLILVPVIPYKLFIPIQNLLSITITGSAFYFGLRYWRLGQSSARLFTIAWAVLITGIVTANLRTLGILPSNFFTQYGYQIGSFVEIVLLSLALGERIQRLQNERITAKQSLLHEKQERMTALHQLILGVSHEMNTPIGNIGLSNSFLTDINNDLKQSDLAQLSKSDLLNYIDQQGEAISMIETSSEKLNSLTHVFRNISIKKKEHPLAEFDLVSLIQDRILTFSQQIEFALELPKHCIIQSHPSAFLMVFDQLFDNVVNHVLINSTLKRAKVKVKLIFDSENLSLFISDNGDGLSEEDLSQLFLPFFTKARGSRNKMGLGMYQVKNIITDLLNGSIEPARSEIGGLQLKIIVPLDNTITDT